MQNPDTVSFIRALEILQSRRGRMTKIIIDQHLAHLLLGLEKAATGTMLSGVPDTLYRALSNGEQALLEKHGIGVIIADGNRHSLVGLCENAVYNVKKLLISLFPNRPHIEDMFELNHRLSLIEQFLNERPTFAVGDQYFTPEAFEMVNLQ